jgi:hypothetical protein
MAGLFGSKWTSTFGEWSETNPTIAIWGAALQGLTEEQLDIGFKAVSDSGADWQPAAPKFKALCLGPANHHEHLAIIKADREFKENQKLLASKTHNREIGLAAMKKIKEDALKSRGDLC